MVRRLSSVATKVPAKKKINKRPRVARTPRVLLPNQMLSKSVPALREELLRKQEGICPLCKTLILPEEAALDHCHSSGSIRMVLHRWCNSVLGKIENWSKRIGRIDNVSFLENTVQYIQTEHTDIIHPTHGRPKKRSRRRKHVKSKKGN